ncbi:hypothetical protein EBR04_08625 [bacterium]|nr:hypothetical protein [bacterium]
MRTLLLLGLVVGGLVVAGAIHISQSDGTIEISVDKQKVEAVTGQVIHEGEAILKNAQNAGVQGGSQTR